MFWSYLMDMWNIENPNPDAQSPAEQKSFGHQGVISHQQELLQILLSKGPSIWFRFKKLLTRKKSWLFCNIKKKINSIGQQGFDFGFEIIIELR